MKLNLFFLWESAAADRDDRGWSLLRRSSCRLRHSSPGCDGWIGYEGRKPLPQGRHFITDRMAPRAITRFLRSHPDGRGALGPEQPALAMAFSPGVWYEGH